MSRLTDEICQLLDKCTDQERRAVLIYLRLRLPLHPLEAEWSTSAESILAAIARSSDLTQRGIRGILAEATFEQIVLPEIGTSGWKALAVPDDQPYDFVVSKGMASVRIQVKLQRKEKGRPKEYSAKARHKLGNPPGKLYVAEVQKTRSGTRGGRQTRPYRFGDFDILAINLHPSTGDWKRFVYTVANWLLPRERKPRLIEIFQPVSIEPDDFWTDSLSACLDGFLSGEAKQLYQP